MGIYYRNNWKQSELELQPAGALIRSRDSPPAATYWLTASLSWYTESPVLTELHGERKRTRCWVSEAKTNWPRYASNVKALTSNKHLHIVYVTFSILCILLLLILQIHKLIWALVKVTLHTLSSHAPPVFCFCLPEQGNYHSHSPAPSPSISYKPPDSCIVCWALTDRTGTDRLLLLFAALFSMLHFRPLNNNSIKSETMTSQY